MIGDFNAFAGHGFHRVSEDGFYLSDLDSHRRGPLSSGTSVSGLSKSPRSGFLVFRLPPKQSALQSPRYRGAVEFFADEPPSRLECTQQARQHLVARRHRNVLMTRLVNPAVVVDFYQIRNRGRKLSPAAEEFSTFMQGYIARWAGRAGMP